MYSFDIFDTLITRYTAAPKGIFMVMQEELQTIGGYVPYLVDNFYNLRVGAEELARVYARANNKQEIRLDDIYRALATTASITEEQQEELKNLEIEVECNNVIGITKNIEYLKELVHKGEHVVLISDMYLGANIIRHLLCMVDSIFKEIPLYVSSDFGKTKKNGGLYQIVKNKESADYSKWVHYGDNECSDIKYASKLGIKAIQLTPENMREYERPQKSLYHQLSIGVSKYVRGLGYEDIAGEIGCSLAGPILYPYINWVLKKSVERGISRLYFVARDGWILKQIADILIQTRNYLIKTYYIYGSRKAWRLPAYDGSAEDFGRILRRSNMAEVVCFKDLADVFQLKWEEFISFLPEEFKRIGEEQKISKFQRDNICRQLQENEIFREYLLESQKEKRKLVIRYLQQEIDTSDDAYAFVELSGSGLTQKCLAQIISSLSDREIKNFYFRLDNIYEAGQCKFFNFYPNRQKRSYMLELLCRAPHGQTEGYQEDGNRIVPVLDKIEGEQIKAYHLEKYREAVLAYVEQMEQACIKNHMDSILIDLISEYMDVITQNPPERIAQYFCHMPFSSGGRNDLIVEFAPAVTNKQLRTIYFWNNGENIREVYQGNSLDYALAISKSASTYQKKCQDFRKSRIGKWIAEWYRYFHTGQKVGTTFFCPWELLRGNIVIYGAGEVGQAYVRQARQRHAKCSGLLWVDSNYIKLKKLGLDVKSPVEIREYSFERIVIAIHNVEARQQIWSELRGMGIEAGKIYYG